MNFEIWQKLLSLESQAIVKKWFLVIHNKNLSTKRAIEITSAAKQSREYFQNARESGYSVRPLLTYYGIICLSRSVTLLLSRNSGEESLTKGHGFVTENWAGILDGDISKGLGDLRSLKIRFSSGLFRDFLKATSHEMWIHVNSSGVDWKFNYPFLPENGVISFDDIISILPDVNSKYTPITDGNKCSAISSMTFNNKDGFFCQVRTKEFGSFRKTYETLGYEIKEAGDLTEVRASPNNFGNNMPQFVHAYVNKVFEIPHLYLTDRVGSFTFSQLALTYCSSYFLGMLVRYYPTQWISLIGGGTYDSIWPTINRLQNYNDQAFPELIIELIHDLLKVKGLE